MAVCRNASLSGGHFKTVLTALGPCWVLPASHWMFTTMCVDGGCGACAARRVARDRDPQLRLGGGCSSASGLLACLLAPKAPLTLHNTACNMYAWIAAAVPVMLGEHQGVVTRSRARWRLLYAVSQS